MKIIDVEAFIPHLPPEPPSWLSHIRVANPMSRYPEYGERRALWMGPLGPIIVRVKTDDGLEGLGLGGGGNPGCFIVEQHLKRLLVGQDPARYRTPLGPDVPRLAAVRTERVSQLWQSAACG